MPIAACMRMGRRCCVSKHPWAPPSALAFYPAPAERYLYGLFPVTALYIPLRIG
jgi:hypothetical protein